MNTDRITSVAIIGAGASGAAAAAALAAEKCFSRIRVFERRESPGGTWIYDDDPGQPLRPSPGLLPPELDPPVDIPRSLPTVTTPMQKERYLQTPIYSELTTNVPAIAMSFSDHAFPYGPFVPHWVPKQYIQTYFSLRGTDKLLSLNTTVEDVSQIRGTESSFLPGWSLTLRQHDPIRNVDRWWREEFDALIIANGHYSVPYIPHVPGLDEYMASFPDKVFHSKSFRSSVAFSGTKVLVIGNSASGHDISTLLLPQVKAPLYQSRRSKSRWDGERPPTGVAWKPIISRFDAETGTIYFEDETHLKANEVDYVIYCTGYKPSYPWWNSAANGGDLWDYRANRLIGSYLHTFFRSRPMLGSIGMPRTLTFRSFEYQAVAIARVFSGRNRQPLPDSKTMQRWEQEHAKKCQLEKRPFHDIPWESGETADYFRALFELAGLPLLEGEGRYPPVLDSETRWAVEHVKKYPEPTVEAEANTEDKDEWVFVQRKKKDLLAYI